MRAGFLTALAGSTPPIIVPHIISLPPRAANTSSCTFTLTAIGVYSASGNIGQISDGQNRIGGGLPISEYKISYGKDGGMVVDKKGRGCILTPPTTQWQCDEGAVPTPGFDIGCDKKLTYKGSSAFHACPVNDKGEWNIYTQPVRGQNKCVQVTLTANSNCTPGCKAATTTMPPPPAPPAPTPCGSKSKTDCTPALSSTSSALCSSKGACNTKTVPPSPPPTTSPNACDKGKDTCKPKPQPKCPTDLNGPFEFPHLIVPVDMVNGDKAYGNRFNGSISDTTCSVFNFDITEQADGKTCSLVFLFPEQKDLETSAYTFAGNDKSTLVFSWLDRSVHHGTTWNTKGTSRPMMESPVLPGYNINVASGVCKAGTRQTFMVCGNHVKLDYFQDFNPSPIGLYIRVC